MKQVASPLTPPFERARLLHSPLLSVREIEATSVNGSALQLSGIGPVSVAADQAGNTNWRAAGSLTIRFTVSRGTQTITFDPLPDQGLGSTPLTLRATSSSGLPVAFQLLGGPATLSGSVLTLLNEGVVTVRARQLGSSLWLAGQTDQTFTIRKFTTLQVALAGKGGGTVSVAPLKDQYAPSDSVTLTAVPAAGFVFDGWSGDLTGTVNPSPLTMSAYRVVTATFRDVSPPTLVWDLPVAGTTDNEQTRLSGTVTDNAAVTSLTWSRDGGPDQILTRGTNGAFAVENVVLAVGTNQFTLRVRDATGNETRATREVVRNPPVPTTVTLQRHAADGQLELVIVAPVGAEVIVETTTELPAHWTETQRVIGQGEANPVHLFFTLPPTDPARFWRVSTR